VKQQVYILLALVALGSAPVVAQDATAGQAVFKKCQACHDIGESAKNRMGPVLSGVVGRVAGTYPGFKYSKAMVDVGTGGLTWSAETLDAFLAAPRDYLPGTKMTNISVKDATDRANVIAYLETLSGSSTTPPGQTAPGTPPAATP
jgi:cytochrome c2